MAAHITGVHRFIKDPATPWDQKLKMAQFAWQSEKCFIPNKHQVLLNWACTSIMQASKFDISQNNVNKVWQYLSDILGSVQLQQQILNGALFSLRGNFNVTVIEMLEGSIDDGTQLAVVLKCCWCILNYPTLAVNLISNFEKLLQLTVKVMKISAVYVEKNDGLREDLEKVLQSILKHYQSTLPKQTSARKLLILTQEQFLIPSIQLLAATSPDLINIQQHIEVILSLSVFNRELQAGYVEYLKSLADKHMKPTELKLIIFQIHQFFEFLKNTVNKQGAISECVCSAFPKLLQWFIVSFKPSNDVAFTFFCKLCNILNLCEDPIKSLPTNENSMATEDTNSTNKEDKLSEKDKMTNWSLILPCIEQMLGTVYKRNIYHVASDEASGKPVYDWLNQLLQKLLNQNLELSPFWYRCLHHMVELNHLLVEPHLKDILTLSLLNASDDPAKAKFFDHVLQVYFKLRQFDRFIAVLLESIRESEDSNCDWQSFLQNFPTYVHKLTPGLSLDVWKLLLNEISNQYVSKLVGKEKPQVKKRKSWAHSIPVKNFRAVASLLKTLLLELPLVSLCGTAPNLKRLKEVMNSMKDDVLVPLLRSEIVGQKKEITHGTYMMCYAWGEAVLLLTQYTSFVCDQTLSLPATFNQGDFSYIHSYITSKEWTTSTSKWIAEKDQEIESVMILLDFQLMCGLLLHEDIEDHNIRSAVEQKVTSISSYSSTLIATPTTTNVAKRNSESFSENYLKMLTCQFPIMLRFLSKSQLTLIARLLIQTLNTDNTTTKAVDIVKLFLKSTVFLESREFQAAFVLVLLEDILSAIKKCLTLSPKDVAKMTQVLHILEDDFCDKVHGLREQDVDEKIWQQLQKVTMAIGSYEHGFGKSVTWKRKTINEVKSKLNALQFLPFEHLIPVNHVRCLLVLCLLNYTMSSQTSTAVAQGVPDCLLLTRSFLKTLCQTDIRGSFLEMSIECRLLTSLTSSLMRQTISMPYEEEHKIRSVTHDVISALLTAAFKTDNQSVLTEMSQLLLTELKRVNTTESASMLTSSRHSITSLLALVSVFIKQATSFARRKKEDQQMLLNKLGDLAEASLRLIKCLQKEDCHLIWHQEMMSDGVAESENSSENLLLCNLLLFSSVLLRYHSEVFNILKDKDFAEFKTKWTCDFLPLLQKVLHIKMQNSSNVVKRIFELFRSICLVADVSDVVSGEDLDKMWSRIVLYFKYGYDEDAKLCGQIILSHMDSSRFTDCFCRLNTTLESQNEEEMTSILTTLKIIPSANLLQHDSWQALKEHTPRVVAALLRYLYSLQPVSLSNVNHVIEAGNVLICILKQGKDLVAAKVAMTTLHVVHLIPLVDLPNECFSECFTMLFRLLNTLLLQFSKQLVPSLPSFLQCVKYLLTSVMFHGREALGKSDNKVPEKILLQCAEDLDRLLTLLTCHKEDVQKVIVVIIAEYINQLQKGTMHSAVKKSLENGVNNIVSVCDDKSLSLLGATLPDSLKEIYKNFYSDYRKHFKYTGRV
ncbi:unhealthy ribosome biogenesis protein 2 homolog [Antedon mediterranea]|uniref:unhealthy ribosome biogenesis protein 2 homolog n=1 Tax=Antedon mediterranea TaxID=105859 RepID=UPI003AF855FE